MIRLKKLLHRPSGKMSRFDRYYAGVLHSGAGYPTADEARQDLRRYERTLRNDNWIW